METPASSRPYRSKIKRPCDRCRRRKTSCILPEDGPCQACAAASHSCDFDLPPTKRRRGNGSVIQETSAEYDDSSVGATPSTRPARREVLSVRRPSTASRVADHGHAHQAGHESTSPATIQTSEDNGSAEVALGSPYTAATPAATSRPPQSDIPALLTPRRPSLGAIDSLLQMSTPGVQHVCSLEQIEGSTAQMCGISAELDPWLLRHCRYDDFGMCRLHGTLIRNVGGVPVRGLVPVHFLLVDNYALQPAQTANGAPDAGAAAGDHQAKAHLDHLVPPIHGQRLYSLFLKFVFPMVPVISRSREALQSADVSLPPMLLAAVYASAIPFVAHDPVLFVSGDYEDDLCRSLWSLASEEVRRAAHAPRLAVLQASILLLQRLPARYQRGMGDTPARQSLHGSTIALAMSLGLHLEPRPWGVPGWEKRLRRRLWWSLEMEDKWTSLLLGRPAMIQQSEWDVLDLDATDFEVDEAASHLVHHVFDQPRPEVFLQFTKLTQLGESIHQTFYTLRASQKLCEDFRASIDAARPIRNGLRDWYAGLPEDLRLKDRLEGRHPVNHQIGVAALHLSYLTLELYLYRAILRPLARSSPPATILPENSTYLAGIWGTAAEVQTPSVSSWLLDDLTMENIELDQLPGVDFAEFGEAAEATLNAAEKCAGIIVKFVANLVAKDFDVHWYPWTRICFATVTSFIALLLVQAPTSRHALRSKELLERWSSCLRTQHKSHEGLMTLGLLRLHSLQQDELGRTFILSPAAASVLRDDNQGGVSG